jgi:1,4-alpha-glucan branching enzyme
MKWDLGWMHDTLRYLERDPIHRRWHHDEMTFRPLYAYNENFVLPLSHDEVVHGKGSLLNKMPGDRWQKFANLRLLFGAQFAQPGKKLVFMGGDFGQWREWNHDASLDWHLAEEGMHRGVRRWISDLNRVYRSEPALHRHDCDPRGFRWVDGSDAERSVLTYLRCGHDDEPKVLCVFNFTPAVRHGYRVGVPHAGRWTELLNSDATAYDGSGVGNLGGVDSEPGGRSGFDHHVDLTLPPLGCVFLRSEAP